MPLLPNNGAEFRQGPIKIGPSGTIIGRIPEDALEPAELFVDNQCTTLTSDYDIFVCDGLQTVDEPVGPDNYRWKISPGDSPLFKTSPRRGYVKMAIRNATTADTANIVKAHMDWRTEVKP